jgi:hypothetical protein
MIATIEQLFALLSTGKTARLSLPSQGSYEQRRVLCVYQHETPPEFSLIIPPSALPLDNIDKKQKSTVLFDVAGQSIIIGADLKEIVYERSFRFTAREIIHHEQLRNYFRVDVSAPLVAMSALPATGDNGEPWSVCGETIDVSGSGILAIFPQPLPLKKNVLVELVLPGGSPESIKAIAEVIRMRKVADDQHHIALHFTQIEPRDKDKIMACCFEIQRKHLRLRVQVKGTP